MKTTFKISIVGCGNVGATSAYALLLDGIATHLTLIDLDKDKAKGIMLDLEHSLPFTPAVKLEASSEMSACKDSNVVIITAGARQREGQTRLELIETNRKIFKDIIPKIAKAAPDSILIIVSNPVDVLAYEALKASKFPWQRVFGTGTVLDTARFQFHLSEKLKISPRSVDAYIMGEHGDSSFPVLSSANIMGIPLGEFPGFCDKDADKCYLNTRDAAYRIINDVGYTCYSISTALRELVKAIFENTNQVFLLSALLKNYYGHSGLCLSVPCVLGRDGIRQVLEVPLSKEEQGKLAESVKTIRNYL